MQNLTKYKSKATEKWFLIDAENVRLGKLGAAIASLLLAKDNPSTVDYQTSNVHIVVVNSDKVSFHNRKAKNKVYYSYSGYPGGLSQMNLEDLMQKDSTKVIKKAIAGMLPKTKLQARYLENVYIYRGAEHKHEAQTPEAFKVN
jgi:large subunit ribosomal protein L13